MISDIERNDLKQTAERTLMFGLPGESIRVNPRHLLDLLERLYQFEHPKPVYLDAPKPAPQLMAKNTVESFDFECQDCGYMFADPPFIKHGVSLCYVCAQEEP